MKRFQEQLKKRSESVRMSALERRELRERLVSYMEYHPLPKSATTADAHGEKEHIITEAFSFVHVRGSFVSGFVGMFAVLILVAVPFAAERAVPGDVLYPVKVNFNEEIRSSLAVSPYAKVEWETKRLERRIAEARLLASEGRLTEEVEAEVTEAVKAHSNAAQEGIAAIRETDSDEAAIAEIAFESALTVQSEVLEGALKKEVAASGGASTTPGHSVAGLAGAVLEARKSVEENKTDALPSYEKLLARMELETTRAYELFDSVKTVASPDEIRDIERRLNDVERKILDSQALHETENGDKADDVPVEATSTKKSSDTVSSAVALLRTALSDLQKLISFMTDIDVRENVTIEELVPITLTSEERSAAVVALQEEAKTLIANFETLLQAEPADAIAEKASIGIEEAAALNNRSITALQEGDLVTAEATVEEAHAYLEDVEILLEDAKILEVFEEVKVTTSATTTPSEGVGTTTQAGDIDGATATSADPTLDEVAEEVE